MSQHFGKGNPKALAGSQQGKTDAESSAALFCIHNKKTSGCVGNCVLLWRVCGSGYTVDLDEAWKLTKEQADDVCRQRPKEDFAIPYELLSSLARRHIDIQGLQSALKAQKSPRKAVS